MDSLKARRRTWTEDLKFETAGAVSALLHLAWMTTLRWKYIDRPYFDDARKRYGRMIFAFWHGQLLVPAYVGRVWGGHVLISESDDGEYIARLVGHLGFRAVRGSATRGGQAALRQMVRASREGNLAVTPDGPRGPRHMVSAGTIALAKMTGLPLFPVASASKWCVRAGSWDRFEIPLPGSQTAVAAGRAIVVPRDADRQQCAQAAATLEESLNALTNHARDALGLGPEPIDVRPGLDIRR
jgi:lysophospholipid acyltransferase (LPLAT)-like uncharacterized protein